MAIVEHASLAEATEVNSENHQEIDQDSLSMLNEMLDQIQSLKIADGPNPTYTRTGPDADYEDFYDPPTTHLVATVEDLTGILDYSSVEVEDMDYEADEPAL